MEQYRIRQEIVEYQFIYNGKRPRNMSNIPFLLNN